MLRAISVRSQHPRPARFQSFQQFRAGMSTGTVFPSRNDRNRRRYRIQKFLRRRILAARWPTFNTSARRSAEVSSNIVCSACFSASPASTNVLFRYCKRNIANRCSSPPCWHRLPKSSATKTPPALHPAKSAFLALRILWVCVVLSTALPVLPTPDY